jgi:glycosyltransferase involved in cell wall biosynthesis
MNVVVVNDFGHVEGGASHVALSSAIGLATRGHRVTLLCAVGPIMPELKDSNVRVVCTQQYDIAHDRHRLRASLQGIWNVKAARTMGNVLRPLDPEQTIVHLHGWTKSLSSSVVRAAVVRGFKVICTLNDYFTACPTGGFFHYRNKEICTLTPLSVACMTSACDRRGYLQKLWRVGRQIVQQRWGMVPGGIRNFICVSRFSRSILIPFLPSGSNLYWNSNVINVRKSEPVQVDRNDYFVMVGRLTTDKGPGIFAQAAAALGCRAIFVGDGECRDEVAMACPAAKITGWCSIAEVVGYLRQARALVFPSLWYEAQPLVVLEAAALGVAAIVSDTSAARDTVVDGKTGCWFRSGDHHDLSKKMAMFEDRDLAKRLGLAAYEHYWSDPSDLEVHLQRLEEIYVRVKS